MGFNFDVDIDVATSTKKGDYGVRAVIEKDGELRPHPSGYYYHDGMPVDGFTGMAPLDHKDAEELGFIKVDLLSNTAYNAFNSREQVIECLNMEPDWSLLQKHSFYSKLPHLAKAGEVLEAIQPESIEELADAIALIRPGKKHLLESYLKNKNVTRVSLYQKPSNGQYYFKRSHAIAYAHQIVCVMNHNNPLAGFEF